MAIPEMNGVGATQGAGASYEVKKQDDKNDFINSSFGQGYGAASGGGQVKTQGNQNSFLKNTTYTKEDFAQLKKYGDNIARDLNEANSRLGGQYAKLERDLVRAMRLIGNPDDPNYITAQSYLEDLHAITAKTKEEFNFPKGGKEANYKDAQASVDRYERNTEALLNGITEDGTFVALMNAAKDIKANDNRNAATNAALTAGYGVANLKATEDGVAEVNEHGDKNTRKIIANDNRNTRSIKSTVNARADRLEAGQKALSYQMEAGFDGVNKNIDGLHEDMKKGFDRTSRENHAEHAETRRAIKSDGEKSRATIQREADRVIDTLDPTGINRAIKGIRDMAAKAGKSVGDFITQNPEVLVPGLGVPIWAARKITAGM